jgi:hypothetical protein
MESAILATRSVISAEKTFARDQRPAESESPDVGLQRAQHLQRRLQLILLDLNLDGAIPVDCVRPVNDGGLVLVLSHRQADRLIQTLENLTINGHADRADRRPGPGQLSFEGSAQ